MSRSVVPTSLIGRGDMRGAGDAYMMKKGAHGGNTVSPVRVER